MGICRPILQSFLCHLLKSFKHEHLFFSYLFMSIEHALSFQLQRLIKALDLERFFLNNKLPTFCDITQ